MTARKAGKKLRLVLIFILTLWGFNPARVESTFNQKLLKILDIRAGMVVADIGAGRGRFTFLMAAEVGSEGHVYANEIRQHLIDKIEKGIKKQSLTNVTTVLGEDEDPKLPEKCDFILFKFVYHHLSHPDSFMTQTRKYLKEDGLLAVVAGDIHSNARYKTQTPPDPCISDPAETRNAVEKAGYIFMKRESLQGRRVLNYVLFFKSGAL